MSDLISRQDAIDILDAFQVKVENGEEFSYSWARMRMTELPSAQPEPRWIPCSERLPKKDGRYLVTRYDYVTSTEFIDILWYEKNLGWHRRYTGDYAVTAWMPLPEPYREERTEE